MQGNLESSTVVVFEESNIEDDDIGDDDSEIVHSTVQYNSLPVHRSKIVKYFFAYWLNWHEAETKI
jgi:hypothetical protein